uniref:Uncharacterized protein n=1 Tax=Panagrolaimus davidi TaxID=227884 RepID=A0A914QSZ9_9BILA
MIFQEKGTTISNRIIMQCFAPELNVKQIRAKRQTSISNEIRVESFESPEDGDNDNDDGDEEDDENDEDSLQNSVTLFVDRLVRMKGFFRSLPNTLCTENRLVASAGELCWNGNAMGRYIRRVWFKTFSKIEKFYRFD